MTIREFTEADYPGVTAIANAAYPDYPETVEETRHYDSTRPEKIRWGRLVAEDAGQLVGYSLWRNSSDMFHPQKFEVDVAVLPEVRGEGVGKRLYDAARAALAPHEPTLFRSQVREDDPRTLRFASDRGFSETMREWESHFAPADFDRAAFAEDEARVAAQGIVIKPLAELSEIPGWEEKLYELDCVVCSGMPMPDVYTKPAFSDWRKGCLENPNFWPGGFFVALDGDEFVGESTLWTQQAGDGLYVGATGVLPEYRRRGIALALKVHACQAAKERGVPQLKTWNATTNVGMLAINQKLGFARRPAWIVLEKSL